MKILAMDTAAAACSVALWDKGAVISHRFQEMSRGHAAELVPLVQTVLNEAQMKIADLDALAVTVGPGGFTGLRIGLSTARGFATASGLPLIGVTTLETLSQAVPVEERKSMALLCCLDAKRADIYGQMFDEDGLAIGEPVARLPEDLLSLLPQSSGPVLVAGDSYERMSEVLRAKGYEPHQASVHLPDARFVAEIAAKRGVENYDSPPSALYIRPPDAALPKNGGRLRP